MVTNTNTSSAPLWTAQEIATATNGKLSGDFAIRDVHIDSRAVGPGDLFVAIKGEYNDAHNFLEQAKDAGAAGFLVQENRDLANNYILVENSFDALWDLAKAARARSDAKSIAITGSVGKTGTKELLIKAFGALGNTSGTQGNLNNHFGLPLTLARLPQEADYAILEMGMSAPEEIRPLSKLGQPHVAIITAIAAAHSEFFDSIEGIALAKSEIFDGLLPNGTAILNQDDRHFDFLRMQLKTNRPDC